jgi:hypothetical protein
MISCGFTECRSSGEGKQFLGRQLRTLFQRHCRPPGRAIRDWTRRYRASVAPGGAMGILRRMSAEPTESGRSAVEARGEPATSTPATTCFVCDACGRISAGPPAGSGLFVWSRGDEVRYEEPPLCEDCAIGVSLRALGLEGIGQDDE